MKAITQDRYGSADVLRLEDVDPPVPDATSVLLKVRSASVNGLDWRIMSGSPLIGRVLFGLTRPKRRIRGVDVAGEVVSVPKSGSRFRPGDAVFGLGSGSFAEYVAADESEIVPKPEGVSYDDAATLGVAAFTALQGLRDFGRVRAGQAVAVTAAGSGVGSFAVQLAKGMGATVTAVTRTENVELLRSIGVDRVVDYQREDITRSSERFDVILDISGLTPMSSLLRCLTPGGRLVIVGARGGFAHFLAGALRRRLLRQPVYGLFGKARVDDLAHLGQLVAEGKLKPVIAHVYSLEETPRAMAEAARHRAKGKLVIRVA